LKNATAGEQNRFKIHRIAARLIGIYVPATDKESVISLSVTGEETLT
jgi:hypothetical protein